VPDGAAYSRLVRGVFSALTRPVFAQDHVFDPEVWARSKPAGEFGPDIGFREYSVLSNPRMPAVRRTCQTRT
jgi:hypothetical protein